MINGYTLEDALELMSPLLLKSQICQIFKRIIDHHFDAQYHLDSNSRHKNDWNIIYHELTDELV